MSYAHKLGTYNNDAHKPVVFCTVCGHETDLSGECSGQFAAFTKDDELMQKAEEIFGMTFKPVDKLKEPS